MCLPIRTAAAIREYFVTALEAGLGDVEMDPLRVELLGEFAYEVGRCTMLVPAAMGKRREERGKYVILSARQDGEWKVIVDYMVARFEPGDRCGIQAASAGDRGSEAA